jgi:hypothetical protein
LVLVARDCPNLEQTAETVRRPGAEALIVDIDLTPEIIESQSWKSYRNANAGQLLGPKSPD